MKKMSKLKAWLKRRGFTSTDYEGDSEYFTIEGFPAIVRLADHVGRKGTETDKYVNIIPDGIDKYVFIYDKITKTMSHKELIKSLDSLVFLHKQIPNYFTNRAKLKKQNDDALREVESRLTGKIITQRAALIRGVGVLSATIADLQKLSSLFNKEREG